MMEFGSFSLDESEVTVINETIVSTIWQLFNRRPEDDKLDQIINVYSMNCPSEKYSILGIVS